MRAYTIYDPVSGDIIRSGTCQDDMVDAQKKSGEAVLSDVQAHFITEKVTFAKGVPEIIRRSDSEIEQRTRTTKQADPMAVLVEALRTKGIVLTAADLQAANDKLSVTKSTQ